MKCTSDTIITILVFIFLAVGRPAVHLFCNTYTIFYVGAGVNHTANDECCQILRMGCHRIETGKFELFCVVKLMSTVQFFSSKHCVFEITIPVYSGQVFSNLD